MRDHQKIVLIADDDPDTRSIVANSIELLGHTVLQAVDGTQALSMYSTTPPDVMVLDVMMPGMSGTEVCSQVKSQEEGRYVPVLMLTARDTVRDKVSALEGGADDYLTKPFHYQELQARVKALLRVRELNLDLREKNQQLQEMQERLVQQERQLLVGQLAGTAAHQLGQPLSAIMLNCHLIEQLPPGDARARAAIASIKQDAKRMAELIEELRTVDPQKTEGYYAGTTILGLSKEPPKD